MSHFKNAARVIGTGVLAATMTTAAFADDISTRDIGSVDTTNNFVTANDTIDIIAFEDAEIDGITCWLSRSVKGGVSGFLGVADNTSDASIACRQTGPIVVTGTIEVAPEGEEVFNESRSAWFKNLLVTRHFDEAANTFVYLSRTKELVDGSPKSSISTVVAMPWPENGQFLEPDFDASQDGIQAYEPW